MTKLWTEYWTIVRQPDLEMIGIMSVGRSTPHSVCADAIAQRFGFTEPAGCWLWGRNITQAEFETYQAFGIEEIKL